MDKDKGALTVLKIQIIVNGEKTLALIDTGASENFMDRRFAILKGITLVPMKGVMIRTASGVVNVKYKTQGRVLNSSIKESFEFYIIENLGHDIILGNSYLQKAKVGIDYLNHEIIMTDDKQIFSFFKDQPEEGVK